MNRSVFWSALVVMCACTTTHLSAQAVDTTVCDILANPQTFDGKIVRVHATVSEGFDEFVLKDTNCKQPVNAIWLAYPDGTKGKAGPAAVVQLVLAGNSPGQVTSTARQTVTLDKNKDFKLFDGLLAASYKGPGRCLGCPRSTVTATIVGRLDGVSSTGLDRDAKGTIIAIRGFGNLNRYSARLVISAVSDITPHEVDYSKAAALPKTDADEGGGDPVAGAHQAAKAFGASNPIGGQIERAAAAFGAEGEDNGVDVGFNIANEIPKGETAKVKDTSPDGARYLVALNMEQLKGKALSEAIAHTGTHIADIRGGKSGDTLFALEERAWQVTVFSAIANREKTLTLPGGVIAWNSAWPEADRTKSVNEAVDTYVADWADLSR